MVQCCRNLLGHKLVHLEVANTGATGRRQPGLRGRTGRSHGRAVPVGEVRSRAGSQEPSSRNPARSVCRIWSLTICGSVGVVLPRCAVRAGATSETICGSGGRSVDAPLRERLLWHMSYESSARRGGADAGCARSRYGEPMCGGNPQRRAREAIAWQTGTARLLPWMRTGRESGEAVIPRCAASPNPRESPTPGYCDIRPTATPPLVGEQAGDRQMRSTRRSYVHGGGRR